MDAKDLVNKLAAEEERAFRGEFLAPAVKGGKVEISISGVPYKMALRQKDYEGWAILRMLPKSLRGRYWSEVVRDAPRPLIDKYMEMLPRFRLILLGEFDGAWHGLSASNSDRLSFSGPVPIRLVQRAGRFDTVYVRFDGTTFWFDRVDRRRPPALIARLNNDLVDNVEPKLVHILGTVPQEKLAYKMLWIAKNEDKINKPSDRIAAAVAHSGATLNKYWQAGDNLTVQLTVDGAAHTVSVNPLTLQVVSAGICLVNHATGRAHDSDFDLSSLIGVFREGAKKGRVVRGDNYHLQGLDDEEDEEDEDY